jgi:hypothetical protein
MAGLEHCLSRIIAETNTTLPKEDVAEVISTLIDRSLRPRSQNAARQFSGEQGNVFTALQSAASSPLADARDMLMNRARMIAAREQANVVANAAKEAERRAVYAAAPSPDLGIQAKLVGTNTAFEGNRNSAEAHINANKAELLGAFKRELEAEGLDTVFMSGSLDRLWARELHELNRRGGQPGVTGNRQALALAEIIQRMQQRGVDMVNAEGGTIGRYDGYIARTTHSPDRLLKMGEPAWLALAHQHFDIATMFPNRTPQYIEEALKGEYRQLVNGKTTGAEGEFRATTRNIARSVSQSRSIHFRDADAWLNYMAVASDHTPSQVVIGSALRAARDAGLMRVWGTNPKHALETDFTRALNHAIANGDNATVQKLNDGKRSFDLYMSYLDGSANGIKNRTTAAIVQNVLTVQRMAKLGALPFSQLADLAAISGELRYQGVNFFDRMTGGIFGAYFRGRKTAEKREIADLVGTAIDGWLGHMNIQLEVADPQLNGTITGTLSRWQNAFFRYSGASWLTDAAREAGVTMMARHFGKQRGKAFQALNEGERRIMSSFSIGEQEWKALSAANWTTGNEGRVYLTPDVADAIPDNAINAWIAATGRSDLTPEQARDVIGDRLRAYYADRQDYAVPNPGIRERAAMYHGRAADDPLGIGLRIFFQFKSFMFASVLRQMGREWYGRPGALGSISGMMGFAVSATALGVAANALSQLSKGQNPFSQWENDPAAAVTAGLIRGGGASIVGDFLFSEWNRHGSGLAEYVAGPSIADATKFVTAFAKLKNGDNPAGDLVSLSRGITPWQNMWWSKWATDALLWNGLAEMANPGYQRRAEKRLKQTQGLEFLRYPVDMSPNHWRAF